jgi:hypothetical protein
MEVIRSSETLETTHKTERRHNREDQFNSEDGGGQFLRKVGNQLDLQGTTSAFWVEPRRMLSIMQRFGKHCSCHLHIFTLMMAY